MPADFLGEALPQALALAAREDVLLRGGLPRELFDFMGVVHEQDAGSDDDEEEEGGAEDGENKGGLQLGQGVAGELCRVGSF